MTIGTILSLAASGLFLLVTVFAAIRKRSVANIALCAVAALLASIEIIDRMIINGPFDYAMINRVRLFLESLLPATLLFFSLVFARLDPLRSAYSARWRVLLALCAIFPVAVFMFPAENFFFTPDFISERMLFLGRVGYWFYLGIMVYCILALVNLETVFSSTSGAERWKIKFEFMGMCGILAVLIFYYSQSLLYRTINMNLIPVRSGALFVASILVGYSKFRSGDDTRVAVSRYILLRSFSLVLIGGYLVFLGLIGEGMRYFGSAFGRDMMIFTAFAAGVFVMIVITSERFRRKIKVFVNKNFYANKYDYREEWLRFTERLSSCRSLSDVQQTILTTFREAFGLKSSILYLAGKEENTFYLAANQEGMDTVKMINLSSGLASYFTESNRVFNPFDKESIPFRDEAAFAYVIGARLVAPLIANKKIEGLVIFGEQLSKEEFIYEDYDFMKTIARQATLSIVNFRLSEEIAGTRELVAVAKISSFVIHDLKNRAYTLSLLLDNAGDYIDDPDFQKNMIETIRNTVVQMNNLIQRLKTVPGKNMLNRKPSDIDLLAQEALDDFRKAGRDTNVSYSGHICPVRHRCGRGQKSCC